MSIFPKHVLDFNHCVHVDVEKDLVPYFKQSDQHLHELCVLDDLLNHNVVIKKIKINFLIFYTFRQISGPMINTSIF